MSSDTVLDIHGQFSVSGSSDSSCSPVKYKPLLVVVWVVIADSKSVSVTTHVLVPVKSSSVFRSTLDLEFTSISNWVSWEVNSFDIEGPVVGLSA